MLQRACTIVSPNGELRGLETGRQYRFYALWKLFQYGWIAGGPGWGRLLRLTGRHRLGYLVSYLTLRYEPQWHALLRRTWQLRAKLQRGK